MTQEIESVNEFLKNGEFKYTPFGMDKDVFVEKYGKSDKFLTVSRKDKRISLIKIGVIEFYFSAPNNYQTIDGVMFQMMSNSADSLKYKIELEWINKNLTYSLVREKLTLKGISFNEIQDDYGQKIIETISKVRFYFIQDNETQQLKLEKFGRFQIEY